MTARVREVAARVRVAAPVRRRGCTTQDLAYLSDVDLDRRRRDPADKVCAVIPSCLGVSLTLLQEAVTFTFAASSAVAAEHRLRPARLAPPP